MKRILFGGLVTFLIISCSESFEYTDPTEFNKLIALRIDIKTAEELAKVYYNYPTQNEGVPELTFETKKSENGQIQVVLIHDKQQDDSQRATKIVITAKKTGQTWQVSEIKENWKCREGRGHTNWGTKYCN